MDLVTDWIHSRNTTVTAIFHILERMCRKITDEHNPIDFLTDEAIRDMRMEHYTTKKEFKLWTKGRFNGSIQPAAPSRVPPHYRRQPPRVPGRYRRPLQFVTAQQPTGGAIKSYPPYIEKWRGILPDHVLENGAGKSVCWTYQGTGLCSYTQCRFQMCKVCITCNKPQCAAI
eukprot:27164_1